MSTLTPVPARARNPRRTATSLRRPDRRLLWLRHHWPGAVLLVSLVVVAGWVGAVNMTNHPLRFEDEGTYVSQAWAILKLHVLAPYTYWYDHPPVGWIQLAAWIGPTHGFDRYESAITAGREFVLVCKLISCGLLYLLARRLQMRQAFAALAVVLFGLSPLAVTFQRYVLLDNIAMPWLLGAFVLALSPRRHIGAVSGSAVCMAIAVLSRETALVLLPALFYQLWQHSDARNRRYAVVVFGVLFTMVCSFYVLYALLKNEFFEGPDHVSLLWAIKWQLFGRTGSGNVLDPTSGAYGLVDLWLGLDRWLLLLAVGLVLPAAGFRRLRPVAAALLIQVVLMLRPGYLPYPYVIGLLPFAALVIAGVLDHLWVSERFRLKDNWEIQARRFVVLEGIVILAVLVAPAWKVNLQAQMTRDSDRSARETIAWIDQHVSRDQRLVIDSGLRVDLVEKGFDDPRAVWLYKTETDPAVSGELGGWRGIDYIAISNPTLDPKNRSTFPTIFEAKDHSRQVAAFGQGEGGITILEVLNEGAG